MWRRIIILVIGLIISAGTSLHAQCNTILQYPYFYYYGWPDSVGNHDSIICTVHESTNNYYYGGYVREFALYQHTDKPLKAVGVAFGDKGSHELYDELNLYDSAMNVLANDTTRIFNLNQWWDLCGSCGCIDTMDQFFLNYPGMDVYGTTCEGMFLKKLYFPKPVEIIGDFYIGISTWVPGPYPNVHSSLEYVVESRHGAPYLFEGCRFRVLLDSVGWIDTTMPYAIPELFLIIDPQCDKVDSIEVLSNADSCVSIRWDALPNQEHWVVKCWSEGHMFTEPVDTNYWESCGLHPNTTYALSVLSRCDFCGDLVWAPDYGNSVQIITPNFGGSGIDEAALSGMVTLSPNPATDEVSIDSPVPMTLVEAYDEKGACILRQELNTQHSSLNTKTWSSGAYILRIHTPQGVATKRLTVMR